MIKEFRGKKPIIAEDCFIADTASIYGDVEIGSGSSVWFGAALRADLDSIKIGKGSNVQENAVMHMDEGYPVIIGDNVTIGHGAIIHGATIGNNVIVGMGAIVMNGAVIGENSLVGAGTLVKEHMVIPEGSVVVGVPGKVIKEAVEANKLSATMSAIGYAELAKEFNK